MDYSVSWGYHVILSINLSPFYTAKNMGTSFGRPEKMKNDSQSQSSAESAAW